MDLFPKDIHSFKDSLSDQDKAIFAFVSTCTNENLPNIRLVHLKFVPKNNALVFNTHIQSDKAKEIFKNNHVSLAYYDEKANTQYRCHAKAKIIEKNDSCSSDQSLLSVMWANTRQDVKNAYWTDFFKSNVQEQSKQDASKLCPLFVTVSVVPEQWDIYWDRKYDYARVKRQIYISDGANWSKKTASSFYKEV